jgi:hypothetical protein
MVGLAQPPIRVLHLLLWDPTGQKVAELRIPTDAPVLQHCPKMDGAYHLQGRILRGSGAYALGIYERRASTPPGDR